MKHHTWTWLRTIWLTGPFALTVAFHNHTHLHGKVERRALDFKKGKFKDACATNKQLNADMDGVHAKYAKLDDRVPFLLDRPS